MISHLEAKMGKRARSGRTRSLTIAKRPEMISKSWLFLELSMYLDSVSKKGDASPLLSLLVLITAVDRRSELKDLSVHRLGCSTIFPSSNDSSPANRFTRRGAETEAKAGAFTWSPLNAADSAPADGSWQRTGRVAVSMRGIGEVELAKGFLES